MGLGFFQCNTAWFIFIGRQALCMHWMNLAHGKIKPLQILQWSMALINRLSLQGKKYLNYLTFTSDSILILYCVWCGLNSHLSLALGSTPSLKLKGCVTSDIRVWSFLPLRGTKLSIYVYIHTCTYSNYLISVFSEWFWMCAFSYLIFI